MFGWDVALGLELLAVIFGFILWFKAVRAETGPRKLAKIVAIIVIIFAVLLAVCTVTRAFMYAGGGKAGWGHGYQMMHGAAYKEGKCPCCGGEWKAGHGPGMMGMGAGMMGGKPCPRLEEATAASAEKPETK
jgi:hypothetical protein